MTSHSSLVVACLVLAVTTQVMGYDSALYDNMLLQDLYKRLAQMDYYPMEDMGYGVQPDSYEGQSMWDDSVIPLDSRDSGQADIRDPEFLSHSSNSDGFQYISGGAGEGMQHLMPEGTQENIQEVKSDDVLPFYCHPPNPCPKGFTEEDGCQMNIKDEAGTQKQWISQLQAKDMCTCDTEHMFDCDQGGMSMPGGDMMGGGMGDNEQDMNDFIKSLLNDKQENPFASGNKIEKLVAKKSPRIRRSISTVQDTENQLKGLKQKRNTNPYLQGDKIHIVAKKGFHFDN